MRTSSQRPEKAFSCGLSPAAPAGRCGTTLRGDPIVGAVVVEVVVTVTVTVLFKEHPVSTAAVAKTNRTRDVLTKPRTLLF